MSFNNANNVTNRIKSAIKNTKDLFGDYFDSVVKQRSPKTGCGSVVTSFLGNPVYDGIEHLCFCDAWEGWEEYPSCPNLMSGCTAFINKDIGGELGIVPLSSLPPDAKVVLDDSKGTGFVSATVKGQRGHHVDFVVAILGQEQGKEVLFTFHPGNPCVPSSVKAEGLHGKTVTAREAMDLGLETAKIVAEEVTNA